MLNNLSAMEIIELMEKIEGVEPTRELSTKEKTIDLIFFKAFGFDWEENEIYKELRKIINNSMQLIKNKYGDCYLIAR